MGSSTATGSRIARLAVLAVLTVALPVAAALPASAARLKTIKIADASIVEGNAGTQNLSFRLTWTGSKGGPAPSVSWATADQTATAGSDYTASSGTVALSNGGCRCATVTVPIKGDTTTESTETFTVDLSNPSSGAAIGDAQAIGTIYDNEGPPALVVTDAAADESAGSVGLSVLLTNASASTVTVDYATADGTATAGSDYTAGSATLTFSPGQTTTSVVVAVSDDTLAEDDETLLLNLTNPVNASIVDAQGVGSILNDDADPSATIADVTVNEGDAGTVTATFTVSLSAASGRETAVDYATIDASATAGSDYRAATGTVTMPAGATSGTFDVTVDADTLHEGDETFGVALSGEVNLTLADAAAVGTITDDDPIPTVTAADRSVGEAATTVTVTIALSNPSIDPVSVDWATVDGSATGGGDYAAASGTATVPAGATSTTVGVTLLPDTVDEPDESFSIALANPVNGTLGTTALTVTIADDDLIPTTLTVKLVRTATTIKAKGLLEPATSGLTVKVTLLKKQGAKYVRVSSRSVPVKALKDRDGDGKTDGQYVAGFSRPGPGAYRFKVTFAGTGELKKSAKSLSFRL